MAMTEAKWLRGSRPSDMIAFVIERGASERKLRLFAVACSRRSRHRYTNPEEQDEERQVCDLAERFADGLVTAKKLASVRSCRHDENASWIVADSRADDAASAYGQVDRKDCSQAEKAALLRDLFGDPFREGPFDPAWVTAEIASLAQAAYDERLTPEGDLDPVRLSILADALEDAGCSDEFALEHLRSPGPHVRGCWVIDTCLGKP